MNISNQGVRIAGIAAVVLLLLLAASASAQCTWAQQPTGVAFGSYSVFAGADETSNVNFSVTCSALMWARVTLSRGGAPTYNPRLMSPGANYNLYLDASYTQIFGDGSGGTYTWTSPQTWHFGNATYNGTIFGDVPDLQDLVPGNYTDTITATLSYSWVWTSTWTQQPAITFPVSMSVSPECRVDTFNLTFGNYGPFSAAPLTAASSVKVYCTRTTTATLIALDNGAHSSGAQKRMAGPAGALLNYSASLASSSGNSTSSLVPIGGGITLNGSIPATQDVPVGSYVDTLQAVVNY